jgi:hypothetical protein
MVLLSQSASLKNFVAESSIAKFMIRNEDIMPGTVRHCSDSCNAATDAAAGVTRPGH